MRGARLQAVADLRVEELALPEIQASEVLLRVAACGVCGTDRHIFHGDYPASLPLTPGHEFAGTVAAVGPGVELAVGARVAVDPNISCGQCRACRRGEVALCPRRVALGVDRDGGFADYARVPATQAYPLPESIPVLWGALCEPLACCLRAVDRSGLAAGASVAVLGGGVIGQLMVQLAALGGATQVILATRQAARRDLAATCGATATVDPLADVVETVTRPGGLAPDGVDIVFECVGSSATFEQAVALVRRGGTVVVVGVAPPTEQARISPFAIFERELRIVGSYLDPLTFGRAVDLVASGRLTLSPLITHQLPLADLPHLLATPPEAGSVKAIVIP